MTLGDTQLRAPRDLRELRNLLSVVQIAIAAVAVALGAGGSYWALALATLASIFAFVRPLPDEATPASQRAWTVIIFIALAASTARAFLRFEFLAAGIDFLYLLVVQRFFNRQRTREHLQLLLLGGVLMTIASSINADLNYPLLLALYLPVVFMALIANHLVAEGERLGVRVAHELDRRGTRDLGLLARAVRQVVVVSAISATLVFVLFPRFGVGAFFHGSLRRDSVSGFGDEVELGGFGRIKTDATVIMRLRPQTPIQKVERLDWHLRGVTLDKYEGGRWERSRIQPEWGDGVPNAPLQSMRGASAYSTFADRRGPVAASTGGARGIFARPRPHEDRPQPVTRVEVHLEDIGSETLFAASDALGVRLLPRGALERRSRIYANQQRQLILMRKAPGPVRYEFLSRLDQPSGEALAAVGEPEVEKKLRWYMQRSPSLSDEFTQLAKEVTAQASNRYEKVEAVLGFLSRDFSYTLDQLRSERVEAGADPVEGFVFDTKAGHCEYFASAMALMLREVDVPTRIVNGYYGGHYNELGDFYAVRQADAHSWVEVHFGDFGWVTFDPTPPDGRVAGDDAPLWPGFSEAVDAMRNAYLVNVVGFNLRTQMEALQKMGFGKQGPQGESKDLRKGVAGIAIAVLAMVLIRRYRRLRGRNSDELLPVTELYQRALRRLAKHGLERAPSESASKFARRLAELEHPTAEAFGELARHYEAARFGAQEASPAQLAELRKVLERIQTIPITTK
jgi:transglutaminase-like putative cysteine protease